MRDPETGEEVKICHTRIELPEKDMDRVRRAAQSIGISLRSLIRMAVLKETADVERRMGLLGPDRRPESPESPAPPEVHPGVPPGVQSGSALHACPAAHRAKGGA